MTNHLTKRGNVYYFRRKIPVDLCEHFKRTQLMYSLATHDPIEARRLAAEHTVITDRQFIAARLAVTGQKPDAPKRLPVLLREYVLDPDTKDGLPSGHKILFDPANPGDHVEVTLAGEPVALLYEDAALRGDRKALSRSYKQQVKDARNVKASVLAARILEIGRTPAAVPPVESDKSRRSTTTKGSASAGHLAALVEAWAKERKPEAQTIDIMNRVITRFYDYVGRIAVAHITRTHVVQFKDKMLEAGQSSANTDTYLTNLRTLLNYAVANLQADANAADGIKVGERRNAKGARLPFDLPALRAIFTSSVYTAGSRPDGIDWDSDAAYWFPLISLHSGARLEEMAQLSPEDVYEDTYFEDDETPRTVWVMRFTSDGEDQGVKTTGSVRRIPIHSALIERGFIEFAKSRRGQKRIFAMAPDPRGREGANWGKWFGKYLRGVCKVSNSRMTFHSFRHTFKDIARDRGIPEDVHDAITGHASGKVSRQVYGGLTYPLGPLVVAMNRYRVLGLELPGKP